ncbi:hypothetical protein HDU76_008848 [Blyttiomyces sp. JEL0837]|nr:hypothetical protein HDU76_008848 [Blyttiomyces sp. JEL0837]
MKWCVDIEHVNGKNLTDNGPLQTFDFRRVMASDGVNEYLRDEPNPVLTASENAALYLDTSHPLAPNRDFFRLQAAVARVLHFSGRAEQFKREKEMEEFASSSSQHDIDMLKLFDRVSQKLSFDLAGES